MVHARILVGTLHVWRFVAFWVVVVPSRFVLGWFYGALMLSAPDITIDFPGARAELDEYMNGKVK